ncbi:MAG TPA: hypothetical protein ENG83_07840 [Nitrospirae bacterium]|nr:hypothetical protein BMS3Abin06_02835 [bacterium BMS3Abin06]HDH12092.1 hypothetical protein [Nitrospirota bacterium]HDZ01218.1 hypothetical protein [Nitrospirota bacterium]
MSENKSDSNRQQQKRDPDLANAEIALKRAAKKAREQARKNGTAIVTIKNNVIREEYPDR